MYRTDILYLSVNLILGELDCPMNFFRVSADIYPVLKAIVTAAVAAAAAAAEFSW
jgi:hypothetical protein